MDIQSGIFTPPYDGLYLFLLHIATHDNKKALLSIRKNGEELASVFDQNHKDNHKNSMAGQSLLVECERGDEVRVVVAVLVVVVVVVVTLVQVLVYAYTGTWLADFPMNHYTHWVGLLLQPAPREVRLREL